jgi:hypothetical protein
MHLSKNLTRDPEKAFAEPSLLVENDGLTDAEKLTLLESWQADLVELQRATEENMGSANVTPGTNAVKLAKVTEAIATIRGRIDEAAS